LNIKGKNNIIRINNNVDNCKIDNNFNTIEIIPPNGKLSSLSFNGNDNIIKNYSNIIVNIVDNGNNNKNISNENRINPQANNNINNPINNNLNNSVMMNTGMNLPNNLFNSQHNLINNPNDLSRSVLLNRNNTLNLGTMNMSTNPNFGYNTFNNNPYNFQNNLNMSMINPQLNLGMSMSMMYPSPYIQPPQNNFIIPNQNGLLNSISYPINNYIMPPNMMSNNMYNYNLNNYQNPYMGGQMMNPINNINRTNIINNQRNNENQNNNIINIDNNNNNKNDKKDDEKNKIRNQLIKEFDEFQYKNKDKFNESFIEEECPICLVKYRFTDKIKVLPCKHIYHKKCIKEWLNHHDNCPLCNYDISKEVTKMKSELEKHIYEEEHPEEEN
jgi:hypothetical protein